MPDSIDIVLSMSDAELFAAIGEALEGGRAAPQDALQREGIGRRYFASLQPKLRNAICNQRIAALCGGPGSLAELAATILDAIRPHLALLPVPDGVPLITIAVLAARSYAELCGGGRTP